MGCIMLRKCHLNTCSVGVATQDPELTKLFKGTPEAVINYFMFLAESLREYMAKLGFKTVNEMVGRTDMLKVSDRAKNMPDASLDLGIILAKPEVIDGDTPYASQKQDHNLVKALDFEIFDQLAESIENKTKLLLNNKINNSKIHSKLINFLDRIFIDVLKSNPSKAPQIFQSFGKSFNGDDMAFFMSSKIRIIPILKMIFNLPTKIFIKSFIRCLFND